MPSTIRYRERFDEFWANYDDDSAIEARQVIVKAADLIALIVGDDATEIGMTAIYNEIYRHPDHFVESQRWDELWSNEDAEPLELPIADMINKVSAYAMSGLNPVDDVAESNRLDAISALVSRVESFIARVPSAWSEMPQLRGCVNAARGRLDLDAGNPVNAEQLAALAGMNLRSMRNVLTPASGSGLRSNDAGLVSAEDALRWLTSRKTFKDSVWRESDRFDPSRETVGGHVPVSTEKLTDEILFIPSAADGTVFHPRDCLRDGHYTIGAKGEEVKIQDYRMALRELASMRTPRWRRPNANGHWGIVSAKDSQWERRTARDLGIEPAAVI